MNVISCSRDKDLRINPGLHYRWECGKQLADGPTFVTELGHLELSSGTSKKLRGSGLKFFYAQLITGDTVDNISGIPKHGPVRAFNDLSECGTEEELFAKVNSFYDGVYGDDWEKTLQEMAAMLWVNGEANDIGEMPVRE